MPEGEADHAVDGFDRAVLADLEFALAPADFVIGIDKHGEVKRLLVAEIVVQQPLVGLGARRDRIDPSAVESALAELLAGGLENFRLGPLAIPRPRRIARPRCPNRRLAGAA